MNSGLIILLRVGSTLTLLNETMRWRLLSSAQSVKQGIFSSGDHGFDPDFGSPSLPVGSVSVQCDRLVSPLFVRGSTKKYCQISAT